MNLVQASLIIVIVIISWVFIVGKMKNFQKVPNLFLFIFSEKSGVENIVSVDQDIVVVYKWSPSKEVL